VTALSGSPGRYPRLPAAGPAAGGQSGEVIRDLATLLCGLGLTHMYSSASAEVAVLSIAPRLTVWCAGGSLRWTFHGRPTTWAGCDTEGAALHLARLARHGHPGRSTAPAPRRGIAPAHVPARHLGTSPARAAAPQALDRSRGR
jgi:hypothetical protein